MAKIKKMTLSSVQDVEERDRSSQLVGMQNAVATLENFGSFLKS